MVFNLLSLFIVSMQWNDNLLEPISCKPGNAATLHFDYNLSYNGSMCCHQLHFLSHGKQKCTISRNGAPRRYSSKQNVLNGM